MEQDVWSTDGEAHARHKDLVDLTLVAARMAGDNGRRTSLDDVIAAFGYTPDQLSAMADPEDEQPSRA